MKNMGTVALNSVFKRCTLYNNKLISVTSPYCKWQHSVDSGVVFSSSSITPDTANSSPCSILLWRLHWPQKAHKLQKITTPRVDTVLHKTFLYCKACLGNAAIRCILDAHLRVATVSVLPKMRQTLAHQIMACTGRFVYYDNHCDIQTCV